MAKGKIYQPSDDDLDSLDETQYFEEDEAMTRKVITDKYMEDISEILSQAYSDIEDKVSSLIEALEDE